MDPSLYKDISVSRGFTYHHYSSKPEDSKPWLVLLHGFPCTSYDWKHQVAFFKERGFGLIVPDFLGYGGSSKPLETEAFKSSLLCRDIIDILDAESINEAIVIGHDWGSRIASRLYNYYPDRFKAFGFLSLCYLPPDPNYNLEKVIAMSKTLFGYDVLGYQLFFVEEGSDKVILEHVDTFFDVLWAKDKDVWIQHLGAIGGLKAALLEDKRFQKGDWLTEEVERDLRENLLEGGLRSPFQWYKVNIDGHEAEDNKAIPLSSYLMTKPTFFAATTRDPVCTLEWGKQMTSQLCKGPTTVKEFDSGHWIMFERKDELNAELLAWIKSL